MDATDEDVSVMDEVDDVQRQPFDSTPVQSEFGMMMISEQVMNIIQTYGWLIALAIVLAIYVKTRLKAKYPERNDGIEYDADSALARQQAMDEARQKMQTSHDRWAEKFAEDQKIKEEEKRKTRIEEWEKHQKGQGYHSKCKPPASDTTPSTNAQQSKEVKKKPIRSTDYNPLTGESASCSYRPGRRGGGGG